MRVRLELRNTFRTIRSTTEARPFASKPNIGSCRSVLRGFGRVSGSTEVGMGCGLVGKGSQDGYLRCGKCRGELLLLKLTYANCPRSPCCPASPAPPFPASTDKNLFSNISLSVASFTGCKWKRHAPGTRNRKLHLVCSASIERFCESVNLSAAQLPLKQHHEEPV